MGDPFKKARPGQPLEIPAEAYNAFVETALAHKRGQLSQTSEGQRPASAPTIKVRNETGQPVPRFGVIGLGEPIILPSANLPEFQNGVAFRGTLPQPGKPFAIAQETLAAGTIGRCLVNGPTPARLNVTEESFVTAGPAGDVGAITTAPNGPARILWREPGTGLKWAIINIGPRTHAAVRFQLISALSPGGAATAAILDKTGQPTEAQITVFDPLAIFSGLGGKKGLAAWMPDAGRYEIIQLEC